MTSRKILTIKDIFQLSNELSLMPDFAVADSIPLPIELNAVIKNSHKNKKCKLVLSLTHFNIPKTTDLSRRWRITCSLREVNRSEIDIGDMLYIDNNAIADVLLGLENSSVEQMKYVKS